jgi:pyrimidine-nucleoside phosphorylase
VRAYDIIRKKRDGGALTEAEIRWVLRGFTAGDVPDYQMAALAMAIFLRGMTSVELGIWTDAMIHSGRVMDLSRIPAKKVDKHSTGGVGDKVSLPLAPLVAACGVPVPMISGRGLGHTGGTLDKLEAIPGFDVRLDPEAYARTVAEVGLCLIGQTDDLCPADRKLYALRDVTATVESIPLIASSIMSKKLAEGIDALVLDVKTGSGAFMKTAELSRELARTMVGIGEAMGRRVVAYITDMDQPLGRAVGNALETAESIATLHGQGPADLVEVTLTLGAEMLVLGEVAADVGEGRRRLQAAMDDGTAFDRFRRMVVAQGGDGGVIDDPGRLPQAEATVDVPAPSGGIVRAIQTEAIGVAALVLGAGRETQESIIDPAVGLIVHKKVGDTVAPGEPLVTLHVNDRTKLSDAEARIIEAYEIGESAPAPRPLIVERIAA